MSERLVHALVEVECLRAVQRTNDLCRHFLLCLVALAEHHTFVAKFVGIDGVLKNVVAGGIVEKHILTTGRSAQLLEGAVAEQLYLKVRA